ncbi:hypothetical protein [Achromobacter sp. NFACC18-2]|uniref:hypothetical protein n=1 Tax=Achromobacter sp. NFACC18-2 TaxID=1564112 RepID=UPI0008CAFC2A|nr:hypothetical protein [Achromobacter sp. NFACC18-2]SEI56396.1 hypothetical protein SAMN03159494_00544 [Achromobacter sp. NFACC18-2]
MENRSARLLWLISGALVALIGCAEAEPVPPAVLTQRQLSDPQAVSQWLRENPGGVDAKGAAFAYDEGQKYKSRNDWSAAAKSFGESAIRYPTPQVLTEYVTAILRMLGEIRARKGATSLGIEGDMNFALLQYQSVMAADDVLDSLTEHEKKLVQANIACLGNFLKSRQVAGDCQPLLDYGIQP